MIEFPIVTSQNHVVQDYLDFASRRVAMIVEKELGSEVATFIQEAVKPDWFNFQSCLSQHTKQSKIDEEIQSITDEAIKSITDMLTSFSLTSIKAQIEENLQEATAYHPTWQDLGDEAKASAWIFDGEGFPVEGKDGTIDAAIWSCGPEAWMKTKKQTNIEVAYHLPEPFYTLVLDALKQQEDESEPPSFDRLTISDSTESRSPYTGWVQRNLRERICSSVADAVLDKIEGDDVIQITEDVVRAAEEHAVRLLTQSRKCSAVNKMDIARAQEQMYRDLTAGSWVFKVTSRFQVGDNGEAIFPVTFQSTGPDDWMSFGGTSRITLQFDSDPE